MVEVSSELFEVDMRPGGGQHHELGLGHEVSTLAPNRPKLGYRDAIAGHHEGLAGRNGLDYPSVVVAQFTLGDRRRHRFIVAKGATARYTNRYPIVDLCQTGFMALVQPLV
jgi:hypothetical protein